MQSQINARKFLAGFLIVTIFGLFGFQCWANPQFQKTTTVEISIEEFSPQVQKIVRAANKQVGKTLTYDPSYEKLSYPGGDVPIARGVCTDVAIRALREINFDLQKVIHEDMKKNFKVYPQNWGLKGPDKNIDHRRVPNQQKYFERHGWSQPITQNSVDYLPGDIVAWKLANGRDHIGVVTDRATKSGRPVIVHNIGWGTRVEDVLFDWTIIGHYRLPSKEPSEIQKKTTR